MLSTNGTNNRYTFITNVSYLPTNQAETGSFLNTSSSSSTNVNTNTLTVDYGTKDTIYFGSLTAGLKWTWTHEVSNTNNSSGSNQASYTINTPNPAVPYPSGSSVSVYQDNIYQTFMFVFPGGGF
jgi:hypothetical protein